MGTKLLVGWVNLKSWAHAKFTGHRGVVPAVLHQELFHHPVCPAGEYRRNANCINDINQVPRPTSSSKWVGEPDYNDVNFVLSDLHKICSVLWSKFSCLEFCNQWAICFVRFLQLLDLAVQVKSAYFALREFCCVGILVCQWLSNYWN